MITGNTISGNGVDPDFVDMTTTIGIMLGSNVDPVSVTVAANRISNQEVGIYCAGPITATGLPSNKFDSTVTTPIH